MPTDSEIRWLRQQPLAFQLAGVEQVWQERADQMTLIADQLWAVGKTQQALDGVVKFASSAATAYEGLGGATDFSRFARQRIRDIAANAAMATAVVSHIHRGDDDGLDTEPLLSVLKRLGYL